MWCSECSIVAVPWIYLGIVVPRTKKTINLFYLYGHWVELAFHSCYKMISLRWGVNSSKMAKVNKLITRIIFYMSIHISSYSYTKRCLCLIIGIPSWESESKFYIRFVHSAAIINYRSTGTLYYYYSKLLNCREN